MTTQADIEYIEKRIARAAAYVAIHGSLPLLTKGELLATFPSDMRTAVSEDLEMACVVRGGSEARYFSFSIEPMAKYKHAADDLLNHCFSLSACGRETHEDHMQRIEAIVWSLEEHPEWQYPIFRIGHPEDDKGPTPDLYRQPQCWEVIEGLHKLVTFQQLGLKTVPVVWVS